MKRLNIPLEQLPPPERAYLEELTKERVCHNHIRGRHEEYYY